MTVTSLVAGVSASYRENHKKWPQFATKWYIKPCI